METDSLRHHLEAHFPQHLALLEDWVGVNTHTENAAGVNELGRRTAEAFARLGFEAQTVPSAHPWAGRHLFLTRRGATDRTVVMVSHLDTVFSRDEEQKFDFRFRREGDKLYGPGVADIKGGTVMALMMLDALRAACPAEFDDVTWHVGLNALEEKLDDEFNRLLRERLTGPALAVLVFEAGADWEGRWPLVVARKGRAEFRIEVEGRGAHAGADYWKGRNAIVDACRLPPRLEALSDRTKELTVNVGRMVGGTEVNCVPQEAVLLGEIRAFREEYVREGWGGVRHVVDDFNRDLSGVGARAAVTLTEMLPAWPRNEATEGLFAVWEAAGATTGLAPVVRQERGGLSDGNLFWHDQPTLDGLGPTGANTHQSKRSEDGTGEPEFVRVSSFVPKALLNCVAVLLLLRNPAFRP
ncbi:MAG: M20/M25/M40 family metallo-hydrolase [Planctomycetes bacterium]|nr:M20/M25/M40 family metallo-hydrolase [Planctomycetota bacterium]